MASKQELQVAQKRELEKKEETTIPTRIFVPSADIYETKNGLNVVLEMPGVDKNSVDIRVEDDVLKVDGKLDFSKYQGLQPLYTEYNVGHYTRSFAISNKIDRDQISAHMEDGVLTLTLPKLKEVQPRRIAVVFHADLDGVFAPGRARSAPLLAEELIDQRLVVLGLAGQAVDDDDEAGGVLARTHLAPADPEVRLSYAAGHHWPAGSTRTAVP